MTTEQSFLIQVLADHINQRKTVSPAVLDFDTLKQIAQQQTSRCDSIQPNKETVVPVCFCTTGVSFQEPGSTGSENQ